MCIIHGPVIRFTKADEIEAEERFDKGFTQNRLDAARAHLEVLGISDEEIDKIKVYGSKEAHAIKRLEALGADMDSIKPLIKR